MSEQLPEEPKPETDCREDHKQKIVICVSNISNRSQGLNRSV